MRVETEKYNINKNFIAMHVNDDRNGRNSDDYTYIVANT